MAVSLDYLERMLGVIQSGSPFQLSFPPGSGEAHIIVENPDKGKPGQTFNLVVPVKISTFLVDGNDVVCHICLGKQRWKELDNDPE